MKAKDLIVLVVYATIQKNLLNQDSEMLSDGIPVDFVDTVKELIGNVMAATSSSEVDNIIANILPVNEDLILAEDMFNEIINNFGRLTDVITSIDDILGVLQSSISGANLASVFLLYLNCIIYLKRRFGNPPEEINISNNSYIDVVKTIDELEIKSFLAEIANNRIGFNGVELVDYNLIDPRSTNVNSVYYKCLSKIKTFSGNRKVVRNVTMYIDRDWVAEVGHLKYYICESGISPHIRSYSQRIQTIAYMCSIVFERHINFTKALFSIQIFLDKIKEKITAYNNEPADYIDAESQTTTESFYNPIDHLRGYDHRVSPAPIRGDFFGVEIEFKATNDQSIVVISQFKSKFDYLLNNGWLLEHDGSVTFEMKSPIMSLAEVKVDFNKCKPLFNAWAEHTDGDKAGLHVHVSFDDMFAVNKHPASATYIFLTKLIQEFEGKFLRENRIKHFKRDFNEYAMSVESVGSIANNRYYWVNVQNLGRNQGKTIEFRLGSSKLAGELDVYVEKVYILAKFIKYALQDWRSKGRPEYSSWKASFGDTKLFKALLPKEMLIRFAELFK